MTNKLKHIIYENYKLFLSIILSLLPLIVLLFVQSKLVGSAEDDVRSLSNNAILADYEEDFENESELEQFTNQQIVSFESDYCDVTQHAVMKSASVHIKDSEGHSSEAHLIVVDSFDLFLEHFAYWNWDSISLSPTHGLIVTNGLLSSLGYQNDSNVTFYNKTSSSFDMNIPIATSFDNPNPYHDEHMYYVLSEGEIFGLEQIGNYLSSEVLYEFNHKIDLKEFKKMQEKISYSISSKADILFTKVTQFDFVFDSGKRFTLFSTIGCQILLIIMMLKKYIDKRDEILINYYFGKSKRDIIISNYAQDILTNLSSYLIVLVILLPLLIIFNNLINFQWIYLIALAVSSFIVWSINSLLCSFLTLTHKIGQQK